MSERPTPETDEQINGKPITGFAIYAGDSLRDAFVPSEFARKLERQRDEAREQLKANHECALILEKMVYQARQERDEARDLHAKAIEERRSTECEVDAMLLRALTAERERDEARAKAKAWKESAVGHRVNNSISRAQRDAALQKIEDLEWQGVHSCHAECQRPACVMRRERDEAREELEDLKVEYEIVAARLRGQKHERDNGIVSHDEIIPKLIRERDEARAALYRGTVRHDEDNDFGVTEGGTNQSVLASDGTRVDRVDPND